MAQTAAVVILIAGVGLAGLPISAAGASRASLQKIVYVDKAELARLHPGWQALSAMNAALSGKSVSGHSAFSGNTAAKPSAQGGYAGRSRSELAAKAAMEASSALDEFEARRYGALRARCDAMKSQMLKSADVGLKATIRDIERAAAVDVKALDEAYGSDLVNARLKALASEVAAKVSKSDTSGIDKQAAADRLQEVNSQLVDVENANRAAKDRILADARAKIDALKRSEEKQILEQVDVYEVEQRTLIARDIASARTKIACELGPFSTPLLFACKSGADLSDLVSLNVQECLILPRSEACM